MNIITVKKYFWSQRRIGAAATAALLVYFIVHTFGAQLGISDGVAKNTMYIIVLSTTVSAFVTGYVQRKFHLRK